MIGIITLTTIVNKLRQSTYGRIIGTSHELIAVPRFALILSLTMQLTTFSFISFVLTFKFTIANKGLGNAMTTLTPERTTCVIGWFILVLAKILTLIRYALFGMGTLDHFLSTYGFASFFWKKPTPVNFV